MRQRWFSRRAVFLHLAFILFVPFCVLATWWQISRAEDGNGLSYLYSFEWPVFALLGVYFWWMFVHTDYSAVGLRGMQRDDDAATDAPTGNEPETPALETSVVETPAEDPNHDVDPALAAYNARLAALASSGEKTWRNPEVHVARRTR